MDARLGGGSSTLGESLDYLVEHAQTNEVYYGRMDHYLWHKTLNKTIIRMPIVDISTKLGKRGADDVTVGTAVSSLYAGILETWLARALVQMCVLTCLDGNDDESSNEPTVKGN
jgi:hypothetical protein